MSKLPKDVRVVLVIILTNIALVFIKLSKCSNDVASKLLDWRDELL